MFFSTNKKKVLIIDDDPSLQRLLRTRLEMREKVNVIDAIDGEKGLAQAKGHNLDLIILDWILPDIQGIEILARLKQERKTQSTPVLMLTGRNQVGNIEEAFDLGADAYLTKPVSMQKLGDKVSEMLDPSSLN